MKTGIQAEQSLRERVAKVVGIGNNVRGEVARTVVEAVHAGLEGARSLEDLMTAVARGAVDGARKAVREGRQPDLVDVVAGVGDGLDTAARALRLTAEHAARAGARQAREDASQLARSFEHAGRRFVIALGRGLAKAGDDLSARTTEARDHLVRLRERLAPVFSEAFETIGQRPGAIAGAAVDAVQGAVRGAGSEARSAVGAALVELGEKLTGPRSGS